MKHKDLVRRLRELTHTKTGRSVKPPDGTVWVFFLPDTYYGDFAMRDGVMMFEYRDGRKPERSGATAEKLRKLSNDYIEIPPEVTP